MNLFYPYRLIRAAVIAAIAAVCVPSFAQAEGRQWGVLIAVEQHQEARFNTLRFTRNDVELLRMILVERAGISQSCLVEMTDASPEMRRPTLANLRRELPGLLSQVGKDDRVLVFYSGHGVLHEGEIYLVPRDFSLSDPGKTGLAASEIRKALAACPAQVKLLILDCCHAGGVKDPGPATLTSEAVARGIIKPGDLPGCVVLASCRGDERSWEWPGRKQGLFSYWLCRALEGGADQNGDGQVTIDEVYRYVHERVSRTAEQLFGQTQTPVRLIGGDVSGVPVVLSLRPEAPESLCRRLAEHLDLEIRRAGLKKVGVLELLQPLGLTEKLAPANLPAYCAEQIRKTLADLAGKDYEVVDADRMRDAAKGLRVEAIGDPQGMQQMSQRAGGVDGVVTGVLRRRGTRLNVQCDLVSVRDGSSLASPSGVLPLSEDLVADEGESFDNRQRPPGSPYDDRVIQHAQGQSGHPLLDPGFPFRVEVWTIAARPGEEITAQTPRRRKEWIKLEGSPRGADPTRKRAELLIPARDGEIFEIRVSNNLGEAVAMTLLVDGMNTLGQKRERLGNAWSWVLEGKHDYVIAGWFLPNRKGARPGEKEDFTLKRFQFVDVAESVAGRGGYGESIGLITAAFYARKGRALGVGEGPEEQRQLRTVDFQAGRLLGVANIRYVDEREVKRMLSR